jgi:phosphoenolpyruvate-protein phosphotransferase/dihydroxyacetone kinase phosphotransfer subunit
VVGIVIVSHSAALAESVVELARGMGGPDVAVEVAGGVDAPEPALGTDAMRVLAAIERADSGDGVLVLMDLGSAVLSAEMALDLLPPELRDRVVLSDAPLVEGAVAAAVTARAGAALAQVAEEARTGLEPKSSHLGAASPTLQQLVAKSPPPTDALELRLEVANRLGLHARPAARFVQTASGFDADITVSNLTTDRGPASARSLNALATLGVRQGHEILVRANGPDAAPALAALEALAERNFDESEDEAPKAAPSVAKAARAPAGALPGLPAAPGIALGPVRHLHPDELQLPTHAAHDPEQEWGVLEAALQRVRNDLEATRARVALRAGHYEASIFDAHLLFLEDEELLGKARLEIRRGRNAAQAWNAAVTEARAAWEGLDDEYLRARAEDVAAVGRQVLERLLGRAPAAAPSAPGIIVAPDLTPAQTASLEPSVVQGIATAFGGPTSHSAILARSLGLPAVVGLGVNLLALPEGTTLALDGEAGIAYPNPPADVSAEYEERAAARATLLRESRAAAQGPATTRDGTTIEVAANVGAPTDVAAALAAGADGVGLLRTEFLFLDRGAMPDEDEQYEAYLGIARALEGRPLVLRTLDVGADKPLPYVEQQHEANPFLGQRGLRLGLARPDVLEVQLRAALRVAAEHPVRIMFPMVATIEEYREAVGLLETVRGGDSYLPRPQVGVMVEVPSAALAAEAFACEVDFFSIGTNDLTQYTLAAERGNERVAAIADPLHPAVLRLIKLVAEAGRTHGAWVGVCGEVGGDPLATPVLLGLGVTELSVAPPLVPGVKEAVRAVDLDAARDLAGEAVGLESAGAVRDLLQRTEVGEASALR